MSSQIQSNCTNCKLCVPVCPTHSILPGTPHFLIDHDTCTNCLTCIPVCPVDAIKNPKVKTKK